MNPTWKYRDIHEYHGGCYYCKYNKPATSPNPPIQCENCVRGVNGCYPKEEV